MRHAAVLCGACAEERGTRAATRWHWWQGRGGTRLTGEHINQAMLANQPPHSLPSARAAPPPGCRRGAALWPAYARPHRSVCGGGTRSEAPAFCSAAERQGRKRLPVVSYMLKIGLKWPNYTAEQLLQLCKSIFDSHLSEQQGEGWRRGAHFPFSGRTIRSSRPVPCCCCCSRCPDALPLQSPAPLPKWRPSLRRVA